MKVKVCLEVGPKAAGAFVPDYPGCWTFGKNQGSALAKGERAVKEWRAWTKAHGEEAEPAPAIRIEPAEIMHVSYNPAEAGKPEPLFWSEVLPVSAQDIDRTLRLMEYSRSDLLKLCSGLDGRALSRSPKGAPRTILDCLRHVAIVELWYITRLDIDVQGNTEKDVFRLLQQTRELAVRNLRRLSNQQRSEIFQPRNDPSPMCNLWTARKVLRRFVDHERLHTGYVKRILRTYQEGRKAP